MKSTQSTQSFSKSKLLSLPFVLGLLLSTASASPIPHSRLSRRNEQAQGCPGTLSGPSGNAYFAFSSNLSYEVAKKACASCYGGVLANVGTSDLQFLGTNLEQPSWIRSWNGDDYSNSCLTIQSSGGAEPGVGMDSACSSQNWPLCQATSKIPDSISKVESSAATLTSLAIAYTPSQETPKADTVEDVVAAPDAVTPVPETDNQVAAPAAVTEQTTWAASVVAEASAPVVAEASVSVIAEASAPVVAEESAPVVAEAPASVVAEESAPVVAEAPASVVAESAPVVAEAPASVVAESAPVVAEASAPVVAEAPASVVAESAPVVAEASAPVVAESVDPLMVAKEKVRAAFEENLEACSAQLAYGEQDPIANEYMIEHMAETASCSQARYDAQDAARLAKEAAI
ncbi:hypothetical protein BG005_009276 [Podila minutissima]|nr:hypothetical protein BG005_009276 [Podila minutissima]